ncbi:transcription factor E2F7 isoform X2 [Hyperolius riggenbachi]|uniref:transcription factor E2F7 isoform X2 n=1 Tax=Hyperolius riggenbachi TaxID=752182 RepID=UPI0035A3463D
MLTDLPVHHMVQNTEMEITGCLTLKDLVSTKKTKVEQEKDAMSAQKENMYDRFRISPRVSMKGEPIDLSKQKGLTPEKFPITPVKAIDRPISDPWTPTANLKMLISVASPEIRDREKKKELFRPIENNEPEEDGPDAQQFEVVDDIDDLEKRPSRKQKSLGLLCQKFLARYPSYPISTEKTNISLDEAASSLGVERRRIYDIVNVLESLHLVSRVAKNQYCWHGQHNLNDTLKNLQREGERQKYSTQIAFFQSLCVDARKECSVSQVAPSLELSEADCPSASASSRKDKSLRIMSQKFVMLFLVSTTKIITLEVAAKILIEESQDLSDHSKFKTKVRRLYDIANVLTSLGLIKKVHVTEERGRKPAFKWIGPADFKTDSDQTMEVTTTTPSPSSKREVFSANSSKQKLFRHSSFNHIQPINTAKRKVCSEPSSPHKSQKVSLGNAETYSSKMAHLAAICRQKIEEDSKNHGASDNLGSVPYSVVVPVPVDCARHYTDHESVASQNGISALKLIPSPNMDHSSHSFLPNHPYMYVPSTSVVMLCGNPEKMVDVHHHREGSTSPNLDQKGMSPSSQPTKKLRTDSADYGPISLVVPKKIMTHETPSFETSIQQVSSDPSGEERHMRCMDSGQKPITELNAIQHGLISQEEALQQESTNSSAVPQYLYVPSTGGLNGFNFYIPTSQTGGTLGIPQSQFNVPYVMVPSTAFAALPFICSPAVPSPLSIGTSGPSLSPGRVNYNLPGMASPPHLMFGSPSVISPSLSESSLESPPSLPPVCVSPVPGRSANSEATESPVCVLQPVPIKPQKSPTPLTPKSIHPVHKDAFFKTPGSLGVSPAVRKNERSQVRSSSSAQRRLDICSSSDD